MAQIQYAPVQITQAMAQSTADTINDAIEDGATFTFAGTNWTADATTLGSWIQTDVVQDGNGYKLDVGFNQSKAKTDLLEHITPQFTSDDVKVTFEKNDDGAVTVHTSATGDMPVVSSALDTLKQDLFGQGADLSKAPTVEVESTAIPNSMSVQAALDYGIISVVSSYTTEYTANAEARNHNIHLAASLLNNSIIKADGGQWSFNGTAGECNADKGFEGAGVVWTARPSTRSAAVSARLRPPCSMRSTKAVSMWSRATTIRTTLPATRMGAMRPSAGRTLTWCGITTRRATCSCARPTPTPRSPASCWACPTAAP